MTVEVPLSRGVVALVDDEDAPAVLAAGKWSAVVEGRTAYAVRSVPRMDGRRTTIRLHTFLTGWPYVDHRDGDGLNNRRSNLRPATNTQNRQNARPHRDNATGYKGVSLHRPTGRYRAESMAERRRRYLGYFPTAELAAAAYDLAALALHGEYARLNFPTTPHERTHP